MIILWHVEFNNGLIDGWFLDDFTEAVAYAEKKALSTNRPTTLTEVHVPISSAHVADILNDKDDLIWKYEERLTFDPPVYSDDKE